MVVVVVIVVVVAAVAIVVVVIIVVVIIIIGKYIETYLFTGSETSYKKPRASTASIGSLVYSDKYCLPDYKHCEKHDYGARDTSSLSPSVRDEELSKWPSWVSRPELSLRYLWTSSNVELELPAERWPQLRPSSVSL